MLTQIEIDALRAAYRALVAGGAVAEVRHGNKIVRYHPADADKLARLIAEAEAELAGRPKRTPARRILF